MAKQNSSKRSVVSTRNNSLKSERRQLKRGSFQGDHDHEAISTQQRDQVEKRRHLHSKERSVQNMKDRTKNKLKRKDKADLDQSFAHDARYPTLAQPEAAYADFHSNDSPPPSPQTMTDPYEYMAYSAETGENYEFDDDRPLSRCRVVCARIVQVPDKPARVPLTCAPRVLTVRYLVDCDRLWRRCSCTVPHQCPRLDGTRRRSDLGSLGHDCLATCFALLNGLALDNSTYRELRILSR